MNGRDREGRKWGMKKEEGMRRKNERKIRTTRINVIIHPRLPNIHHIRIRHRRDAAVRRGCVSILFLSTSFL